MCLEVRVIYSSNKAKGEKIRNQTWKHHIDALKTLMIGRGIGTQKELSSQEKVLFKVVQLVTSDDLLSNYPPLHLTGKENASELHTAREKYRRGKQDAALGRLRDFILGAGFGKWRNIKTDLERVEVLKLILEHIQNDGSTCSTAATSPRLTPVSTSSVSPTLNANTSSQTNIQTTGHNSSAGSSLQSPSRVHLFSNGCLPVASPFSLHNTLPGTLPSAIFVPFVPYNSGLQSFMLNSFMNPNSVAANQLPRVEEENDKSEEEEDVDIVGSGNSELKNNEEDDGEVDIIN
ncbi:unnamed protein product [Caenorhabditis brenneri]